MRFPDAIVLLYHRVAEPAADPWGLRVAPGNFAEQMEVLHRRALVVPLSDIRRIRDRARPVVSITFDDGYLDNLTVAKPLLEKFALPATAFVMTAGLAHDHTPWWDDLEAIMLGTEPIEWPAQKDVLTRYLETWQRLRDVDEARREAALESLLAESGRRRHEGVNDRLMRADEVASLAAGGLIEVGAHTRSHPSLASLPLVAQESEIAGSRAHLEDVLGMPVTSFAYPFGRREHYTPATVALVREAGFLFGCAHEPRPIEPESSNVELPRVPVKDHDGDSFERWLFEQLSYQ